MDNFKSDTELAAALEEINAKIKEVAVLNRSLHADFEVSLTEEQKAMQLKNREFHSKEIGPLYEIKKELELQEKIKKALKENPVIKIKEVPTDKEVIVNKKEVTNEPMKVISDRRQHYILPLVSKALKARCHVWLVGPAGSGKSTLASTVAAELNLSYAALSVCSQTTKTDLLGYMDAHGVYRSTSFRQIYENGGVFCLDEIDNGNANVLAVLNSALANDSNEFPDKAIKRHPDFVVIACANTFGLGATSGYVGRVQIDAATLDRFFFVEMPYDDGLESHIAGYPDTSSPQWDEQGQKVPTTEAWLALVKKTRDSIMELGIKSIISPRATYMGIALIKQDVPIQFLEKGLLYKAMSLNTIDKIRQS